MPPTSFELHQPDECALELTPILSATSTASATSASSATGVQTSAKEYSGRGSTRVRGSRPHTPTPAAGARANNVTSFATAKQARCMITRATLHSTSTSTAKVVETSTATEVAGIEQVQTCQMKSSSSATRNNATRKLRALAKEVAMRRKKKGLVATVRATVAFATGCVATATAAADAVQRVLQSTSSWTDAGSGKRRDETRALRALAKRSRRASKRKAKMRRGLRRSVRVTPRRDGDSPTLTPSVASGPHTPPESSSREDVRRSPRRHQPTSPEKGPPANASKPSSTT